MNNEQKERQGDFIVIEGIDGSGKSTQASLLHETFTEKGAPARLLAEPSNGKWGREIRRILGGEKTPPAEELLTLFIKDRQDDVTRNINPAFDKGETVIMDRYFYSNAAYQGAMGLDYRKILYANRDRNFPLPDHVFFIDIPVADALARIAGRNRDGKRDIFEKEAFLEKVRKIFLAMKSEGIVIIDGRGTSHEIHESIMKHLTGSIE